jgi:acyl-coenzyme A thioesterase PaaI-like protein
MDAFRKLFLVSCLLTLGGCFLGESWSGTTFTIETEISFVSPEGRPLGGETVSVAETIGGLAIVTGELKTDAEGTVRLEGRYCGPLNVGVDGGYVTIRTDAPKSRYTVTVHDDRSPSFSRLFGSMPADIATRKRSRLYRDCG